MTGIASATDELRLQGLLHLIRRTHVEHDARIAMSKAIHQAEVVVIGRGDYELAGRIAQRLLVCGGRLAAMIGPDTRFAVRAPRATTVEIDTASARGVAVIDEGEFDRMVEIYAVHTGREQVRAAARRALDANRIASSVHTPAVAPPGPRAPGRRMATSREDAEAPTLRVRARARHGGRARHRTPRAHRARVERIDPVPPPAPAARPADLSGNDGEGGPRPKPPHAILRPAWSGVREAEGARLEIV